jgi:signal transduction histidine kinase/CheY-like chemotaxis protein
MNSDMLSNSNQLNQHSLQETVSQLQNEISLRERYEKELEHSKKIAEQATEYKSIFLANMSHEIRTPLGLILGFTEELIESSQLNPANRHLIHIIKRNSEVLARLINDILDISKIEAGKLDFDIAPIPSLEFAKDLETNFQAKCTEKALVFHLDLLTALPEYFYSDEVRIKQILLNLVSNAIKHTDTGGLILKMSYNEANNLLTFDVVDSGEGISPDLHGEIFELFKQLHKGKPGTGLGLALSRNLARGLEGDLKLVRSRPGEGTWFRVEIKNQRDKAVVGHTQERHVPEKVPAPDLTGWKILIVDDLIDNIRLLEAILRPTKAITDATISAKQAVQKVKSMKYDLILLDLLMPEQDGFKTLDQLREAGHIGEVWAVSAHAMKTDVIDCTQAGFNEHVSKPIPRNEFYQKLKRLTDSKKIN